MDVSILRTTSFDNVDNVAILPCSEAIPEKSILPATEQDAQDQDALEAIKLDPAVLEVLQTKVGASSSETTPNYHNYAASASSVSSGRQEEVQSVGSSRSSEEVPKAGSSSSSSRQSKFEDMMGVTKAALFSLNPQQFDLLLQFVATLRQQRLGIQKCLECAFCKRNGEAASWYSSHALKDGRGRIRCPVLRAYHCPRCGATGDNAHTIKYCQSYDD